MAAGFSVFVYGLATLPQSLPPELMPPPTYTPANQIPSGAPISEALTRYQIQSAAFKFIMAGVGSMAVGLLILAYINCCYEIDISSQIVPLSVQRRDGTVLPL